jgi:hypothetical protein
MNFLSKYATLVLVMSIISLSAIVLPQSTPTIDAAQTRTMTTTTIATSSSPSPQITARTTLSRLRKRGDQNPPPQQQGSLCSTLLNRNGTVFNGRSSCASFQFCDDDTSLSRKTFACCDPQAGGQQECELPAMACEGFEQNALIGSDPMSHSKGTLLW